MRHILALTLAAIAGTASADIAGVAETGDGSAILIHNEQGPCVGDANRAEYVAKDGTRIPGCWVMGAGIVLVVFFDGDLARVPVAAIKPPKRS